MRGLDGDSDALQGGKCHERGKGFSYQFRYLNFHPRILSSIRALGRRSLLSSPKLPKLPPSCSDNRQKASRSIPGRRELGVKQVCRYPAVNQPERFCESQSWSRPQIGFAERALLAPPPGSIRDAGPPIVATDPKT